MRTLATILTFVAIAPDAVEADRGNLSYGVNGGFLGRIEVGEQPGERGSLYVVLFGNREADPTALVPKGHSACLVDDFDGDGFRDLAILDDGESRIAFIDGADGNDIITDSGGIVNLLSGGNGNDTLWALSGGGDQGADPLIAHRTGLVGQTAPFSFLAYDAGFTGGVFVAVGDVDGEGVLHVEVITFTGLE